jgi:catechol 2,3-dioxygenase-like lactoylglutathione lyase family enzyme
MIDHTGIGVEDIPSSAAFYDAALGALGMRRVMGRWESERLEGVGYGVVHPVFWIDRVHPHSVRQHTAFAAKSRAEVDAFHAAALRAGGTDNGSPGLRPPSEVYPAGYYAAFVLDPGGNNIAAVYRERPAQLDPDTPTSMFQVAAYDPPLGVVDPLQLLTETALTALKTRVVRVQYPAELCQPRTNAEWLGHCHRIPRHNPGLFESIKGRSGVYVILTAAPASQWTLRYIGQSNAEGMSKRIRSHLVWRNKETQSGSFPRSKFDEVSKSVAEGKHIGFSFVEIDPASLRHYVEDTLIRRFHPRWNVHGTSAELQRSSAGVCQWPRTA